MIEYTKLKLTKAQYNDLTYDPTPPRRKNVIVFQFAYSRQDDPYPRLKAYAMDKKHVEIPGSTPVELKYSSSPPSTDLSKAGKQVIGDLQIEFVELQNLKRDSNPGHPESYRHLLFEPKYDAANQHIYFEVSVIPSTNDLVVITKSLKPSPPYGAV